MFLLADAVTLSLDPRLSTERRFFSDKIFRIHVSLWINGTKTQTNTKNLRYFAKKKGFFYPRFKDVVWNNIAKTMILRRGDLTVVNQPFEPEVLPLEPLVWRTQLFVPSNSLVLPKRLEVADEGTGK